MTRPFPASFLAFSAVLAASVLLPLPGADGRILHLPAICPFYQITGLPCPGCGLTRAFVCLGHGQVLASLHWHPLGWLIYGICLGGWAGTGAVWLRRGRPLPFLPGGVTPRMSAAALTVIVLAGAARIAWLLAHHQHWPG